MCLLIGEYLLNFIMKKYVIFIMLIEFGRELELLVVNVYDDCFVYVCFKIFFFLILYGIVVMIIRSVVYFGNFGIRVNIELILLCC